MTLEATKLVLISREFTDAEAERVFNDTVIESEAELRELVGCLEKHRPAVARRFAAAIKGGRSW